jgi:hypothetical protein
MPPVPPQLKRICLHWTAGGLTHNATDKEHYHFICAGDGSIHLGKYKPEANGKSLTNRDQYAAHCGGGNSFTIGIAVCGGPKGYKYGTFTQESFERACEEMARCCLHYGIAISEDSIYTHYEFGKKHPGTDSSGKIDINQLPWDPKVKADEVGDVLRKKVNWYLQKLKKD